MQEELIKEEIKQGLIAFDENKEYVTYTYQSKKRKYTNPEEQVQTLSFLKLILHYNYPVERIKQFEPVKMGSSTKTRYKIVRFLLYTLATPLFIAASATAFETTSSSLSTKAEGIIYSLPKLIFFFKSFSSFSVIGSRARLAIA